MGEEDAIEQESGTTILAENREEHSGEATEMPERRDTSLVAAGEPATAASETDITAPKGAETDDGRSPGGALDATLPNEAATDRLIPDSRASEGAGGWAADADGAPTTTADPENSAGRDAAAEEGASGGTAVLPGDARSAEAHAERTVAAADHATEQAEQDSFEPPARAAAELKAILEALIFASPEPLSLKALTRLLDSEPKDDVAVALEGLKEDYERPGGLQLVEVAGGYQIVTRHDLHEWVRRLFHERSTQKLSAQALETLAVVAYRQPITAVEITEIRGVNTSGVLNTLLERHLIKIVGRKAVVGRPFMYSTTKEFLSRFGLNDLTDLPRVEDMVDALGLEAPLLVERAPLEDQLPLDEPDAESDEAVPDDAGEPHDSEEPKNDGEPGGSIH